MAEYIEREAVFKIVADMMCDCKVRHKGRAINRNIKQLPTADVVEVVRCKDCENYNIFGCADGFGWCESFHNGVTDEHYCSHGKRRCEE